MASTPGTSFTSDHLHQLPRYRPVKRREKTPSKSQLPSPPSYEADNAHEPLEAAYQAIWNSFCGLPSHENPTFQLNGGQREYERLYERLDGHEGLLQHFEATRKSWNSDTGELTLHFMAPSPLHDFFVGFVSEAFKEELDRLVINPSLRPFCSKIASGNSTRIRRKRKSRAPDFEKSPDGQWHYDGARYPPFILEVAYSQDRDDLVKKVIQFFEKLPGGICNILGFDIKKSGDRAHTASVSLWTSDREADELCVKRTIKNQLFHEDGQAILGDLVLPFKLFMPFKVWDQLPPDLEQDPDTCIRLPFARLSDFVSQAERRQRIIEGSASPSPGPQPPHPSYKRVTFQDEDGTVTKVTRIPKRQRTREPSVQSLGRTRAQTRSVSQPRRSGQIVPAERSGRS